jgi:hypothetical protein
MGDLYYSNKDYLAYIFLETFCSRTLLHLVLNVSHLRMTLGERFLVFLFDGILVNIALPSSNNLFCS